MIYEVHKTKAEARERAMALSKEKATVMVSPAGGGSYVVTAFKDGGRRSREQYPPGRVRGKPLTLGPKFLE